MALNDFKDTNQGGGVLTVSNSNIGKGIKWNDTTKKYEVDVDVLVSTEGNVAVLTGEIAHGGTIPLPAGFTQDQCKWAVMPKAIYDRGGEDINNFQVFADANRLVTIYTETGVHNSNRATYIIVGVK